LTRVETDASSKRDGNKKCREGGKRDKIGCKGARRKKIIRWTAPLPTKNPTNKPKNPKTTRKKRGTTKHHNKKKKAPPNPNTTTCQGHVTIK